MPDRREDLLGGLRSDDWSVRTAAAQALRDLPGEDVTRALARALDSDDTAVTQAAVDSLVARGGPLVVELIWTALGDLDEDLTDHIWFFLEAEHAEHVVTRELLRRDAASSP